jgi:hypothetical protein
LRGEAALLAKQKNENRDDCVRGETQEREVKITRRPENLEAITWRFGRLGRPPAKKKRRYELDRNPTCIGYSLHREQHPKMAPVGLGWI